MIKQDYRILNWYTTILGKPTDMTAKIEFIDKAAAEDLCRALMENRERWRSH